MGEVKIYVDDYRRKATVLGREARWSHLFAIPPDNRALREFGAKIGLKPAWLEETGWPHFDVTDAKRSAAIKQGAQKVSIMAAVRLKQEYRECEKHE